MNKTSICCSTLGLVIAVLLVMLFVQNNTLKGVEKDLRKSKAFAKLRALGDRQKVESANAQFEGIPFAANLAKRPEENRELVDYLGTLDPEIGSYMRRAVLQNEQIEFVFFTGSTLGHAVAIVLPDSLEVVDYKVNGTGQIVYRDIPGSEDSESLLLWYNHIEDEVETFQLLPSGFKLTDPYEE